MVRLRLEHRRQRLVGERLQIGLDGREVLAPRRVVDLAEQVNQFVPVVRLGLRRLGGDAIRERPVQLRPGAQ